jgi:hypothetical protein
MTSPANEVVYRLNDRDEITYVNEGWCSFARANQAVGLDPEHVLHRPLWGFVADSSTRQLYRDLLASVRTGRTVRFEFRCDMPGCRRLLEMEVCPAGPGAVEFRTRVLWEQPRVPVSLLAEGSARSEDLLRVCSWCKRVDIGGEWAEVEEAVARLRLFDLPRLPMLTHGICQDCFTRLTLLASCVTPLQPGPASG